MIEVQHNGRQEGDEVLEVGKVLLLMAYIIKCTDQVKDKTEEMRIIVKGAEKYLGMREASWEDISRKLEAYKKAGGANEKTD